MMIFSITNVYGSRESYNKIIEEENKYGKENDLKEIGFTASENMSEKSKRSYFYKNEDGTYTFANANEGYLYLQKIEKNIDIKEKYYNGSDFYKVSDFGLSKIRLLLPEFGGYAHEKELKYVFTGKRGDEYTDGRYKLNVYNENNILISFLEINEKDIKNPFLNGSVNIDVSENEILISDTAEFKDGTKKNIIFVIDKINMKLKKTIKLKNGNTDNTPFVKLDDGKGFICGSIYEDTKSSYIYIMNAETEEVQKVFEPSDYGAKFKITGFEPMNSYYQILVHYNAFGITDTTLMSIVVPKENNSELKEIKCDIIMDEKDSLFNYGNFEFGDSVLFKIDDGRVGGALWYFATNYDKSHLHILKKIAQRDDFLYDFGTCLSVRMLYSNCEMYFDYDCNDKNYKALVWVSVEHTGNKIRINRFQLGDIFTRSY